MLLIVYAHLFFSKALELRPECPYMLTLVAKGFKSFPKEYCDYDKMKELLLKARERAPNHYLLIHDLGWLYKSVYGVSLTTFNFFCNLVIFSILFDF